MSKNIQKKKLKKKVFKTVNLYKNFAERLDRAIYKKSFFPQHNQQNPTFKKNDMHVDRIRQIK